MAFYGLVTSNNFPRRPSRPLQKGALSLSSCPHPSPQEELRIIDNVEWGWAHYDPTRIKWIFGTKMRVIKAVVQAKGSNQYEIPRASTAEAKPKFKHRSRLGIPMYTPPDISLLSDSRPRLRPHCLQVNDRVDVQFSDGLWYRGTVVKTVSGYWARVKYDDDDEFNDYFDERPGAVLYRRLLEDAPRRKGPVGDVN